jgi:hypothetical protein
MHTRTERARADGIPESTARGAARRIGINGGEISDDDWKKIKAEIGERPAKRAIIQSTMSGEEVARFESSRQAERITGIERANITANCRGRRSSAGGYVWSYAE